MSLYEGRKVLIKLDLNGVGGSGANWATIGQQRDGGLDMDTETVDGTTKTDEGWANDVIVGASWSISCDGVLDPADSAWTQLYNSWEDLEKVWIQRDASQVGGIKKEGEAVITKLSEKFGNKELVSFSAEFKGQGKMATSSS